MLWIAAFHAFCSEWPYAFKCFAIQNFFFGDLIYLQAVIIHSANGGKC
jgi:hypothetical protein